MAIRQVLGLVTALVVALASSGLPGVSHDGATDFATLRAEAGTTEQVTIVGFVKSTSASDRQWIVQSWGGHVIRDIQQLSSAVVGFDSGSPSVNQMQRVDSRVRFVEPDAIASAAELPNDPEYQRQWWLQHVDGPDAWSYSRSSPSVVIAILDSGIDFTHPDLGPKVISSRNLTNSPSDSDLYGHGTHVAGIAAAVVDNDLGVASIGRDSDLMNVKVLGDNGSGYYSWIATGIVWATDHGAKVINLSVVGSDPSQTLADAVGYAIDGGAVVVAAAGNGAQTTPVYPAAIPGVISVAASDESDSRATFSNHGDWVKVAAPGTDILSTLPVAQGGASPSQYPYGYKSGTSMSAPIVSGLAALVWTTEYGTSPGSVEQRIVTTAWAPNPSARWTAFGIVDPVAAVGGPPAHGGGTTQFQPRAFFPLLTRAQ